MSEKESARSVCVVFLAHLGVQQPELWTEWANKSNNDIHFIVCQEEHEKGTNPNLAFKSLFDDDFKERRPRRDTRELWVTYDNKSWVEKRNIKLDILRNRRSLELGTLVMKSTQREHTFGTAVPLDKLVPSEWSSPEIALNTAAALKFAVQQTCADLYWIVSGFDIPLVHPDRLQPFVYWKRCDYGFRLPEKTTFDDSLTLMDGINSHTEQQWKDIKTNIYMYEHGAGEEEPGAGEEEPKYYNFSERVFDIAEFLHGSGLSVESLGDYTSLSPVRGSQWMCLVKEDAEFIGDARDNLMELATYKFYMHNNTLKKNMNIGSKAAWEGWKVADETFIHTLLAHKYKRQEILTDTTYMPYWIPWDTNKLTNDPNTWWVDIVDVGVKRKHYLVPAPDPLIKILKYGYHNMHLHKYDLGDLRAIVSYRKVDKLYIMSQKEKDFLNSVWDNGFKKQECLELYNLLHGKLPVYWHADTRADLGTRLRLRL